MNKVLDLIFNGSLSKKNSIFFNNIINFNIKNFNILIESIFKNNDVKNNYFLTPGFSRNTLSSPIFHYYISSIFIKKYKKKIISYDVIFTDNYYHTKYIKFFLLKNNINKKFRFVQKNNLLFLFAKITIFNIIIIFKEFVYRICQFVFSNLSKKNYVKPIGLNNIIIIDKYIFPKYITKERYYNFLENNLPVNILNKIYYVPTIEYCKFNQIFYIFKN